MGGDDTPLASSGADQNRPTGRRIQESSFARPEWRVLKRITFVEKLTSSLPSATGLPVGVCSSVTKRMPMTPRRLLDPLSTSLVPEGSVYGPNLEEDAALRRSGGRALDELGPYSANQVLGSEATRFRAPAYELVQGHPMVATPPGGAGVAPLATPYSQPHRTGAKASATYLMRSLAEILLRNKILAAVAKSSLSR